MAEFGTYHTARRLVKGKEKSLKEFRAPKKTGWNWFILKESGLERLKTVVWKKKNVSQRKTVF